MATLTYNQYKLKAPATIINIMKKYAASPQAKPPKALIDRILNAS